MERWRRVLFVTYAVTSYVYRWWITFVILYFMATFLKPYKLEIISNMLALVAVGSMIGWPIYRLCKGINKRGRIPDMKPTRVTVTTCVLAVLLLAFFLLPLPVSRVREAGLVQVQPHAVEKVPVELPGRLMRLAVKEGDHVKKGAILAEFQSQWLDEQELKARMALQHQTALVREFDGLLSRTTEPAGRDKLIQYKTEAAIQQKEAQAKLQGIAEARAKLTLRAPRDGVVMGLPHVDELYKTWEAKDLEAPFCSIGDPTQLRVLVPLTPTDYDLVRDDLKRRTSDNPLQVTIRVRGLDSRTWGGRVTHLPTAADKTIPLALSTRGGGPLAIKPTSQPNALEPQAQVYLVGIDVLQPDAAIAPGTMAQVKIHCEYRSCAWAVWRWLSSTFDLGLL
jgi:putative peptide zinc metalloprotease protein